MPVAYEYVFSGLAIVLMISVSIATIFPIAFSHIAQTEAYQLQPISQSILDKILLTPGHPSNWGVDYKINASDSSSLKEFGLSVTTKYENLLKLDPNKLERLTNSTTLNNPYYLPPSKAVEILGIKDKFGFSISVKPVLKMASSINSVAKNIKVRVENLETIPIPNVNVTAILIRRNTADIEQAERAWSITDWNGTAIIDFSSADDFNKLAYVLIADFYGLKTMSSGGKAVVEAVLIGSRIIVKLPSGAPSGPFISSSRSPLYVVGSRAYSGSYANGSPGASTTTFTQGGGTYIAYDLAGVDNDVTLAAFITKAAGTTYLVSAFRPYSLTYQSSPLSGIHRYTLTRLVDVAGTTLRIEFHLWRIAE